MIDYGLISVIIPVYNAEKYLKKCLDSVLSQTYTNYEVILVDDGSTDASSTVCDEYASKYDSFVVIHKTNGGASTARNEGIRRAKGDYIFFLDSDDWINEFALEKLIKTANDEGADLVFCEAKAIDDNKNIELEKNYGYKKFYETGNPYKIMEEMMENKEFHVAIWMLLVKREIFTDNDLFFKEGIIYEDMIISYQFFCLANRASHVREKLYFRRYRENSVMTSKKTEKNIISAITVYNEVSRFKDSLPEEYDSNRHIVRCAFNVFNIYRAMPSNIKKQYVNEYKNVKRDILSKNAYGDRVLKFECYNHILWIIYKSITKVFK